MGQLAQGLNETKAHSSTYYFFSRPKFIAIDRRIIFAYAYSIPFSLSSEAIYPAELAITPTVA